MDRGSLLRLGFSPGPLDRPVQSGELSQDRKVERRFNFARFAERLVVDVQHKGQTDADRDAAETAEEQKEVEVRREGTARRRGRIENLDLVSAVVSDQSDFVQAFAELEEGVFLRGDREFHRVDRLAVLGDVAYPLVLVGDELLHRFAALLNLFDPPFQHVDVGGQKLRIGEDSDFVERGDLAVLAGLFALGLFQEPAAVEKISHLGIVVADSHIFQSRDLHFHADGFLHLDVDRGGNHRVRLDVFLAPPLRQERNGVDQLVVFAAAAEKPDDLLVGDRLQVASGDRVFDNIEPVLIFQQLIVDLDEFRFHILKARQERVVRLVPDKGVRRRLNVAFHLFGRGFEPLFHIDPAPFNRLGDAVGLFCVPIGHVELVLVDDFLQNNARFDRRRSDAGDRDDVRLFRVAAGISPHVYRKGFAQRPASDDHAVVEVEHLNMFSFGRIVFDRVPGGGQDFVAGEDRDQRGKESVHPVVVGESFPSSGDDRV